MTSKTIIISALQNNSSRGILTLFQEDDLLKCRLRIYNLSPLSKYCKLGIYHNNEVFSANLIEKNGVYESSFVGNFKIENDFYVALIDVDNNNEVLLAGGTYQGFYFSDNSVFLENENFLKKENKKEECIEEKENSTNCEDDCNKCAKCKYKEFFYSQQTDLKENQFSNNCSPTNLQNQNITNELVTKKFLKEESFNTVNDVISLEEENENPKLTSSESINFDQVQKSIYPQIEKLFSEYEKDEELNLLITSSKFVKIEEGGESYSIGAIYENDNIKYICYAIKRDYNINPPQELGANYQWLPLDPEDPLSVGYYVVFQDAKDFKIVKI